MNTKKDALMERLNVTPSDCKKVEQLLDYWKALAKKGALTVKDFDEFRKKVTESRKLWYKYYAQIRNKFLNRDTATLMFVVSGNKRGELPDNMFVLMKEWSKKFISRFEKYFEPALTRNIRGKSVIEDSEDILERSSKVSYRWASGIIISNHIATVLTKLINKTTKKKKVKADDIMQLYDVLRKNTNRSKLRIFLVKSYRRFEDADKTRNRCAHTNEGKPTKQEIEQSISLAKLLQRYL